MCILYTHTHAHRSYTLDSIHVQMRNVEFDNRGCSISKKWSCELLCSYLFSTHTHIHFQSSFQCRLLLFCPLPFRSLALAHLVALADLWMFFFDYRDIELYLNWSPIFVFAIALSTIEVRSCLIVLSMVHGWYPKAASLLGDL